MALFDPTPYELLDPEEAQGLLVRPAGGRGPLVVINHGNPGVPAYLRRLAVRLGGRGVGALVVAGDGRLEPRRVADVDDAERAEWRTSEFAERYLRWTRRAMEQGSAEPWCDGRVMLLGFCGGGWQALKLAADGASVERLTACHVALRFPPEDPRPHAIDLVPDVRVPSQLHLGGADPLTPPADVAALRERVAEHRVPMEIHVYDGAMHGFLDDETNDPANGVAYHAGSAAVAEARLLAFLCPPATGSAPAA
jgi:carboxymethylenebutenolidase